MDYIAYRPCGLPTQHNSTNSWVITENVFAKSLLTIHSYTVQCCMLPSTLFISLRVVHISFIRNVFFFIFFILQSFTRQCIRFSSFQTIWYFQHSSLFISHNKLWSSTFFFFYDILMISRADEIIALKCFKIKLITNCLFYFVTRCEDDQWWS